MMADVRRVKTSGRSSLKRVFVLAAVLCFAKLQQKMVVDSELPGFLVLFSQARVARDGRGRTRVISSPHLLVNCRSSSSATIFLKVLSSLCRGAEPRHTVVRLCVCHSVRSVCSARWKVSIETCNASRTPYYLAFDHLKVPYEALFSSYGVICLPWLPLLAIWTSLKTILPTVVCLAACRICLY